MRETQYVLVLETFTSAHEEHARLRRECPVAHSTAFNGFWGFFRYQDVVDALRQPGLFITSVQNVVPKVAFTGRRPPLHFDPPEHTPYRRALNPFFTEAKMRTLEPAVRRIVADLLNPLIASGGGEVCAEFTRKLPGYVFAEFFHLPTELSMAIKETTVIYNQALQQADDQLVKETSLQLYAIARQIIELRKAVPLDPAQAPTSAMLKAAGNDGELLPEPLVLGTIRQLIVVGMIAPSVLVPCIMIHLARHLDLQNRLRHNPALIPAAVEEYLRLYTPYRGFARTPTKDITVGGREIREGEPVAMVHASANRDEAVFENPDEFILNRPNIDKHLAFGVGPHRCAGMPLARMMLRVTREELLKRARIAGVSDDVVMTRWPEWGVLSASLNLISIKEELHNEIRCCIMFSRGVRAGGGNRAVSGDPGTRPQPADPHRVPAAGLAAVKGKLPIIGWGNGGCSNNGLSHRNFLVEIASYGFLAIAIGPPKALPAAGQGKGASKGDAKQGAPKGDGKQAAAGPATKSSQLIDAMNWVLAENNRKGSPYNGKLDASKIAVMGMSCGGIQSYAVATDPRVKLVGIFNSGILPAPGGPGTPAMEDVRKDQLDKLHSPIFFVTGDKSDIAHENGMDDLKRITKVPAIHTYKDGVSHGGTYSQPNGGDFARVAVAMLKWQLKGDKESSKFFLGPNCGLCQETGWHVATKGIK